MELKKIMLLTLILAGCALPEKSMPKLPFEPMEFTEKTFTISEIVHIEDYLARIPDRQVDIDVHNTLKLRDFISVLTAAGINIIANISPETEITVPKYSGDIKPLLKGIQESHGLHFYFSNNTLSIREKLPVSVLVLFPETKENVIALVQSFGVENPFYDASTSRVVFESDYITYMRIKDYFAAAHTLNFVVMDVVIIETDETESIESGIDLKTLAASMGAIGLKDLAQVAGLTDGGFLLKLQGHNVDLQAAIKYFQDKGHYRIIQNARLSTINGHQAVLDISDKIPYVDSIQITSLSDNAENVQAYTFASVSSGLVLTVTPIVHPGIIAISFDCRLQNVKDFLQVGPADQQISRPVTSVRSIKSTIGVTPGEIVIVGGLKYQGVSRASHTLIKPQIGSESLESSILHLSIVLRASIVSVHIERG